MLSIPDSSDTMASTTNSAAPASVPRLAVLIDADNTSPAWAEAIFEEVATLGEASVRRIYGDFSNQQLSGWNKKLENFAVLPHQQFAYTKGKNSSDITLVIDAMDLLHSGRFDGFVLVSSDSDFTRLASRIREQGSTSSASAARRRPRRSARPASGSSSSRTCSKTTSRTARPPRPTSRDANSSRPRPCR